MPDYWPSRSVLRWMSIVRNWEIRHVVLIPYIRLFTYHVFSANSILKPWIKSTRIDISRNNSKSLNLPDLEETVKFTRMHFSRVWYSCEHSWKWMQAEKTWNTVYKPGVLSVYCWQGFGFEFLYRFDVWMIGKTTVLFICTLCINQSNPLVSPSP